VLRAKSFLRYCLTSVTNTLSLGVVALSRSCEHVTDISVQVACRIAEDHVLNNRTQVLSPVGIAWVPRAQSSLNFRRPHIQRKLPWNLLACDETLQKECGE
ncbi:unnamed protein product, partial [Ectocarpus sp. 12 AP-2014]